MSNTNILIQPCNYVKKGWGYEVWICNFPDYCGKILGFNKDKKCSWHYHKIKDEVLYVAEGQILLRYGWSDDIEKAISLRLMEGMSFHITTGLRHQMQAVEDSKVIEFSTHHEDSDSIRITPGD
jgi:quercetin dioxygenase-like cupin family protein